MRDLFKCDTSGNIQIPQNSQLPQLVKDWISKWNLNPKFTPGNCFSFYIAYHPLSVLLTGKHYIFDQDLLKNSTSSSNKVKTCPNCGANIVDNTMNSDNQIIPIVHLILFDVFDDERIVLKRVGRYKKIIDSSIWNYYVPLEVKKNGIWEYYDNYAAFSCALKEIYRNDKLGLYNLAVTREYADLNARLTEQSFIDRAGGHKAISPFLFHSEKEMRLKIFDSLYDSREKLKTIHEYKWRFLLLDDKCIENMDGGSLNKLEIIVHNLITLGFNENRIWFRYFSDPQKLDFQNACYGLVKNNNFKSAKVRPCSPYDIEVIIDCVDTIEKAEGCLKQYKYEVILLDYLLNKEYSYELLEEIRNWHQEDNNKNGPNSPAPKYHPGPNRRFFFMFISAYTTAVNERLLERGMSKTERRLWYIGDGACPTNTPYLFSYQLLDRMKHRVSDLKKEDEAGKLSLIELMEEIFLNKKENDVRKNAHEHFRHILYMRSKYLRLENDLSPEDEHKFDADEIMDMKSSLLIHSAFHFIHHFSGAFYEHLQHLIYLIAYGTIRQWTELWEEYVFVHKTFSEYDSLMEKKLGKKVNKGQAINDAIREYIINLKENCN